VYDETFGYCIQCDETCLTCSGTGEDQCLTCDEGESHHMLFDGYCVLKCPTYYYELFWGPSPMHRCDACHSSCLKCSDTEETDCIECTENRYKELETATCEECSPSCKKCTGPGETECSECRINYYLTEELKCDVCPLYCWNCTSANECHDCAANYFEDEAG